MFLPFSTVRISSYVGFTLAGAALLLLTDGAAAAQFDDFRIPPSRIRPAATVKVKRNWGRLKETAAFALHEYKEGTLKAAVGRFLFDGVGCGTECQALFGVDLETGEVKLYEIQAFEIDYRANSRLLVVNKGGLMLGESYPERQFLIDDRMNLYEIRNPVPESTED